MMGEREMNIAVSLFRGVGGAKIRTADDMEDVKSDGAVGFRTGLVAGIAIIIAISGSCCMILLNNQILNNQEM